MPTRNRKILLLFLILYFTLAFQGRSQDPKPQPKPPEPAATAEQKPPDYSQEPFVFEQFQTRARFEKDGTGERETSIRVRVQSEAGVQALGQLVFGYNSGNERLDIEYVRVRKSDGTLVAARAEDVQDLTAPIAREAPVYTDFRQKHVTVPGLRPGEILEYKTIHRLHTALAPGHFWLEHDFIDRVIVLEELLVVDIPADSKLKLKTEPGADPEIRDAGGRRVYTWKHANLTRKDENEDRPKKKKPKKHEVPAVQLTTFQSWEDVGRWYASLENERKAPSDPIRAKVSELAANRSSDLEKVRAIYDFVAKNFRYVSLSFGVGRYQPHAAAEVFANQYGDCKDKHTLLAAMARAAGLRAYPVLINSSRKIDPEIPSPSQFDHVITAVPLGEETLWMDTTTEIAPFRLLSASLRDKQALLVPDDAAPRLVTTPPDPPFSAMQRVEIEGGVTELGKLNAKVRYTLRGDSELLLRSAFRRTPRNQWKQLAQVIAYSDGLRGEVTEVNPSDPAATDEPFRVEYQISQAGFLDWSSKKGRVHLPLPATGLPRADGEADDEEEGAGAEPLEFGSPLDVQMVLKLTLPERFSARAPIAVGVKRDYAEYSSAYKLDGSTLSAERKLRFLLRQVPATRSRDYQAFARAVRADEGQELSVESTVAGKPEIPETAKADELLQAASVAFRSENYRLAEELLNRLVALEPKHSRAWLLLGTAQFLQQEYDGAAASFQKQAELNPYDENAYAQLGTVRWRQQRYEEAEGAFRKQMEVNPLHKAAQGALAQMLVEWRKYEAAVPELEKAISLTPDDPSLHVSLGRGLLSLGQNEKALAAFDKAVELSPEPTVWNNIAYYLSVANTNLDRAQQYAESAVASVGAELRNLNLDRLTTRDLQRVSSLAAYWDTLGWVYFQRGDLDKAERYVTAAWQLDLHGEVGDHLGQIYEKQGRKAEALKTYSASTHATRPAPETKGRIEKLNTGKQSASFLMAMGQRELADLQTIQLGKLLETKETVRADFFVVFVPAPAGKRGVEARVEAVKFISGNEALRPLGERLKDAKFPVTFPDGTPTRLLRRGSLLCLDERQECIFAIQTADSITSVN